MTKFAPPERVADYMAVHTFFTGVRGVIAPIVAFQLALELPLAVLGFISSTLIVAATLLLVPEIKLGRKIVPAPALMNEPWTTVFRMALKPPVSIVGFVPLNERLAVPAAGL